ncbi:Hypothetical protein NTJ_14365 [Nesidiocoris tenuis]|uniref:Uncharacterized protein n=1 Tax=Nesidiocoris tenuis TaxID=355587 RepID=A0ABN7BAX1_9HEMI|nr:Hypothetical protein NTJ_14365 [Nesidiocoris tenuis]
MEHETLDTILGTLAGGPRQSDLLTSQPMRVNHGLVVSLSSFTAVGSSPSAFFIFNPPLTPTTTLDMSTPAHKLSAADVY